MSGIFKESSSNMRPLIGSHFGQVAQITEHVFLSSAQPLQDPRIDDLRLDLVISATLEPPVRLKLTETLQIPIDDNPQADIGQHFDAVADRINSEAANGRRILVHCMAGVSRSAALVLAYLVKHTGVSLRQAHTICKRRRPFVRPNAGFWRQLCAYELAQRGQQSVKMVESASDGLIPDLYLEEMANGSSGGLCWISLNSGDSRP